MNFSQSKRNIAGIVIVVVISLIVNLRLLLNVMRDADINAGGTDIISVYERKFKGMNSKLPSKGIVGYIDDRFGRVEENKSDAQSNRLSARFNAAQYALAPHLIEYGMGHRLVIGNFLSAGYFKDMIPPGAKIREDFGDGLVLLERVAE